MQLGDILHTVQKKKVVIQHFINLLKKLTTKGK